MVGVPSGIGQVKRDLGALIEALGIVGGGGSPNELRSDAGVMVGIGVEETLKRHQDLITQQADLITISTAINTTGVNTFSFPEDHYIQSFAIGLSVGLPADAVWWQLTARPQVGTPIVQLLHGFAADS